MMETSLRWGDTMTTATASPPTYFRTQRPDDPLSSAAQATREAHFAVFAPYIDGDIEAGQFGVKTLQDWLEGIDNRIVEALRTRLIARHLRQQDAADASTAGILPHARLLPHSPTS